MTTTLGGNKSRENNLSGVTGSCDDAEEVYVSDKTPKQQQSCSAFKGARI